MKDTSTVAVTRLVAHPVYKKRVKKTKKYLVHDTQGHNIGETVSFVAGKPVSKLKKWRIYTGSVEKTKKTVESKRPAKKTSAVKESKQTKVRVKKEK